MLNSHCRFINLLRGKFKTNHSPLSFALMHVQIADTARAGRGILCLTCVHKIKLQVRARSDAIRAFHSCGG